jgi:hypothetical protein
VNDGESLKMENFSTEETLLDLLGLKKATLNRLRHEKGFPFIGVTPQVRLYYLPDVARWLLENKRVLNRGMTPGE